MLWEVITVTLISRTGKHISSWQHQKSLCTESLVFKNQYTKIHHTLKKQCQPADFKATLSFHNITFINLLIADYLFPESSCNVVLLIRILWPHTFNNELQQCDIFIFFLFSVCLPLQFCAGKHFLNDNKSYTCSLTIPATNLNNSWLQITSLVYSSWVWTLTKVFT